MEYSDIERSENYPLRLIAEILRLSEDDIVYFRETGDLECFEDRGAIYVTGASVCRLVEETIDAARLCEPDECCFVDDGEWPEEDLIWND
jgi:hypothetical protein